MVVALAKLLQQEWKAEKKKKRGEGLPPRGSGYQKARNPLAGCGLLGKEKKTGKCSKKNSRPILVFSTPSKKEVPRPVLSYIYSHRSAPALLMRRPCQSSARVSWVPLQCNPWTLSRSRLPRPEPPTKTDDIPTSRNTLVPHTQPECYVMDWSALPWSSTKWPGHFHLTRGAIPGVRRASKQSFHLVFSPSHLRYELYFPISFFRAKKTCRWLIPTAS